MKQRLLSPEGLSKRVALLDNVKSLKFSWAELESLVTAPTISGKRMYVGEGSRPNSLTWIITLNGVSLGKDISQRSCVVKLGKPQRSGPWAEETLAFIEKSRSQLIADCIGLLSSDAFPLPRCTRWATWEKDVLSRLPEPAEAQAVILERQDVADVENEEAALVQEFFAGKLRHLGYSPDSELVFLPSRITADWFSDAIRERVSATAASRRLKQGIREGTYVSLQENKQNRWGRGFVWCGATAPRDERIQTDLEAREEELKRQNQRGF